MAKKKTAVKKKAKAKKSPAKAKKPKRPKAKASQRRAPKSKRGVEMPAASALPWREPLPGESKIGVVDDYFAHINVIAFALEQPLSVGDKIHVRGHTTDLAMPVESMQIGHETVAQANPADAIGIKVSDKCRKGDYVYKCA